MEHRVNVLIVSVNGETGWRGECDCGWRGAICLDSHAATRDSEIHIALVTQPTQVRVPIRDIEETKFEWDEDGLHMFLTTGDGIHHYRVLRPEDFLRSARVLLHA